MGEEKPSDHDTVSASQMEKKVESWGKIGPLRRVFPWQKWLGPALTPGSATVQAIP